MDNNDNFQGKYLYHYTSIESLALILHNKTLCFNNLLNVDDLEEVETKDLGKFGKVCNIFCFTDQSEESIAMWHMYGNLMSGVRIRLDKDPFKKYNFKNGDLEGLIKNDICTSIDLKKIYEDETGNITPDNPKLIKVKYTEDENLLYPQIRTVINDKYEKYENYDLTPIGKYKRKCWEFQEEWRYKITSVPWSGKELERCNINTHQELMKRLQDPKMKAIYDKIFLELRDDVLDNIHVLLGPKVNQAEEIMVRSLIEKYSKNGIVERSKLKIR